MNMPVLRWHFASCNSLDWQLTVTSAPCMIASNPGDTNSFRRLPFICRFVSHPTVYYGLLALIWVLACHVKLDCSASLCPLVCRRSDRKHRGFTLSLPYMRWLTGRPKLLCKCSTWTRPILDGLGRFAPGMIQSDAASWKAWWCRNHRCVDAVRESLPSPLDRNAKRDGRRWRQSAIID